ncbi:MAG TPA: DUF6010 family protein [Propionibacteriaceae bacterium]
MITQWLVNGAILAGLFVLVAWALSRWTGDVVGRTLLALGLIGAGLAYVYYAAAAGESVGWLAAELLGVAIYGSLALRGVRRSPMWLAAGWLLHPVWDLALHFWGPGHSFAPDFYPITCLSFDTLVAAYVVVRYRSQLVGPEDRTSHRSVRGTRHRVTS